MYDRVALRAAASAGLSVDEIAHATGATRTTVRRALNPDAPLNYHRVRAIDTEFGDAVRAVLARYPRMKAPAVAYRIGYDGPMRTLRHVIAQARATEED